MKLTDEVIDKMLDAWDSSETWRSHPTAANNRRDMRRAAEVLVPLVLKEALDLTHYECDAELTSVIETWDWSKLGPNIRYLKVMQMLRDAVCIWASKRLCALTAEPSLATVALDAFYAAGVAAPDTFGPYNESQLAAMERAIAAVDEARKGVSRG